MSLTITEKQHWKERIEARITAEVKKLKASDTGLFKAIREEAHQTAVEKLGLTEACGRITSLAAQIAQLKKMHEDLELETAKKLNSGYFYNASNVIESAINELIPAEEERLMAQTPTGNRVLELEKEKQSLLDIVWLATSSPQVRELWLQVDALLGAAATQLQTKLFQKKLS